MLSLLTLRIGAKFQKIQKCTRNLAHILWSQIRTVAVVKALISGERVTLWQRKVYITVLMDCNLYLHSSNIFLLRAYNFILYFKVYIVSKKTSWQFAIYEAKWVLFKWVSYYVKLLLGSLLPEMSWPLMRAFK